MAGRPVRTAVLAAVLAAPLLLSGCSGFQLLPRQASGVVESPRALALAWRTPASQPDWVPADAVRIRFIASSTGPADATPATVRATTASALPRTCRSADRRSLSAYDPAWAPDAYPRRVERCGDWEVVRVDDGWFGWTPAAPEDREG